MRRTLKILAWVLGIIIGLPLVLIAALLIFANTGPGRHELEHLTDSLTGGMVQIQGLTGRFPDALHARRIEVADTKGVYATIDNATLDWSPLALLHGEALIDRLDADQMQLARLPVSNPNSKTTTHYSLPVRVVLRQLAVQRLNVGPAVAGQPVSLALNGSGTLDSLSRGTVTLTAHRLDGEGQYALNATVDPARIQATVRVSEPPQGLIAGILKLRQVGAIAIDASVDGPKDALATQVHVTADPLHASAQGVIDLTGKSANLTVTANAPAMTPLTGVSWQSVHIDAKVSGPFDKPNATGTVRIADLKAEGASIGALTADLSGNAGIVQVRATADDVHVPGPNPDLLASVPLLVDATVHLDQPDRPATLTVHHPLLTVNATAQTAGAIEAKANVLLPDLAPFAAAAGTDLQGHANLDLTASQTNGADNLAVQGTVGVTGGKAPVPALIGDNATLDLAAQLKGKDITLSRLAVNGKALTVSANGGVTGGQVNLDWAVRLADLTAVRPDLSGAISAHGSATGPQDNIAINADLTGNVATQDHQSGTLTARIQAQGLPSAPSAHVVAQGTLLNSPVNLDLTADRKAGALQVSITQADWKSLHAAGALSLAPGETVPTGTLTLDMTHLADLTPLLGEPIAGSVKASLTSDPQATHVSVAVQGVAVKGTASVAKATVEATISGPDTQVPDIDGTATLDGVTVAGTTASGRLTAHGPADALAVRITANAPHLDGAPATMETAGTINGVAKTLDLTLLRADWKQQALRLLAPAKITVANGVSFTPLRLGLGRAVLEVAGRTSPTLDLTVNLRDLPADIAAVADPAYAANGTIAAEAHLTGTTTHPDGTIRVTASGVHLRQGPGQALPAANLTAMAKLTGTVADLDTHLTAGNSHLALTGSAPLSRSGTLHLHTNGVLHLTLLDPILASEGRRIRGTVDLNAGIAGTVSAPRVTGTATLSRGDVQDVTLGAHITDMAATIDASGDTIRLTRFTGRAGKGTVGASGTVGLAGAMPIDLRLTASDARPIASNLMTAVIDANMTVTGALKGNMEVAGLLRIRQANIRVPDKLPASVAVLPVRVAGVPPPPPKPPAPAAPAAAGPANVALNITVDAPEQVFIRGRGLYAELGGTIHIRGTAANPQPDGGLKLRRGTFSLAGQTLNFTQGSFDFTGAGLTDPSLDLVATSTTSTMVATLTVSGSAKDPKITLSSVPQAPQDEILAQLLFQSTTAKLSPFQIAEIASALASLTGAPSAVTDPLAGLRSTLGLDQLTIGSDAAGNPALQAGSYVARGVYVGAQQSTSGTGTQATVQVDLAKGLKLQTTAGSSSAVATGASGTGDAASVGLTYQFQY